MRHYPRGSRILFLVSAMAILYLSWQGALSVRAADLGKALCFFQGQAGGRTLRMRFEAHTEQECREAVESWCRTTYPAGQEARLDAQNSGYFKRAGEPRPGYRFLLKPDCMLQKVAE